MRKILFICVFALMFLISIVFAAFNMTPVTVSYYFGDLTLPLSTLLVVSVLIGMMIGASVLFIISLKLRYENRRLQHKVAVTEQEINSLRILPIKDAHPL